MKVVDNFLPDDEFQSIRDEILGNLFPWYWQDNSHGYKLEGKWVDTDNVPQLTHTLVDDGKILSDFFSKIVKTDLFDKLKAKSVSKLKLNCNYKTSTQKVGFFHTDYRDDSMNDITTSILYFNTNNGGTKFEDDTFVNSVANRVVTFKCSAKHAPVSCTDEHKRVVLNINYYEK